MSAVCAAISGVVSDELTDGFTFLKGKRSEGFLEISMPGLSAIEVANHESSFVKAEGGANGVVPIGGEFPPVVHGMVAKSNIVPVAGHVLHPVDVIVRFDFA